MYQRDYRDILAGGLLAGVGLFAALYASTNYAMGTPRHMGPGWFPVALGILMVVIGLMIMVPAFFRQGTLDKFEVKSVIMVCGAILAFALLIRPLGLVPATLAISIICALLDNRYGVVLTAITGVLIATGAVLIFIYGLGMPIQIVNWRFFS